MSEEPASFGGGDETGEPKPFLSLIELCATHASPARRREIGCWKNKSLGFFDVSKGGLVCVCVVCVEATTHQVSMRVCVHALDLRLCEEATQSKTPGEFYNGC
jgi:hypothetical protein